MIGSCILCQKREFAHSPKKKLSPEQGSCSLGGMGQYYGSKTLKPGKITLISDGTPED